jgi:hypothetical protein
MSYFDEILLNPNSISLDSGSRLRVSQFTTLLDGKILNSDNPFIWDNQGTGSGLYSANKYNMSVTSGQFFVRQSKRFMPYFAGKSQFVECTFDNFQIQANTVKRVGYFSSNAVSPFASNYDGFWLENDGTTYRLKAQRAGVTTIDVPWTSWDNYNLISSYDWSTFTVIAFDFLWLGGAQLRIFLKTDLGFVLAHTVAYSGTATDTFILSPNQPIRYEIRSTTGVGSLRYICSQVSTEGSFSESGYNNSVNSLLTSTIASNTVSAIATTYPVKAIRKKVLNRDNSVKLTSVTVFVSSANDILLWSVQLNPILSAPLSYTDVLNSAIQEANGSATAAISTTVTSRGRILANGIISESGIMPPNAFTEDYLQYLGCSLNNTMDELILCVTPITANITLNGTINFKEY